MDKVEKSFQDKAKGILRAEIKRRNLGYGELSNRCKDAIQLAGERGVSAEELATSTMRDKGLDPADQPLRTDFIRRFHWALGRLQRDGRIDRLGHGRGVRWRERQEQERI